VTYTVDPLEWRTHTASNNTSTAIRIAKHSFRRLGVTNLAIEDFGRPNVPRWVGVFVLYSKTVWYKYESKSYTYLIHIYSNREASSAWPKWLAQEGKSVAILHEYFPIPYLDASILIMNAFWMLGRANTRAVTSAFFYIFVWFCVLQSNQTPHTSSVDLSKADSILCSWK
jgi:hypothetical protein